MKKKIFFVVCLLFGLMFINAGLNKFFNYMPVPEDMPENMMRVMGAFMEIGWLIPLVAVIELAAGCLIIFPRTRPLAAIMIFPIMVGILLTHIVNAPSGLPIAIILFAINIWVIVEYRNRYLPMISGEADVRS